MEVLNSTKIVMQEYCTVRVQYSYRPVRTLLLYEYHVLHLYDVDTSTSYLYCVSALQYCTSTPGTVWLGCLLLRPPKGFDDGTKLDLQIGRKNSTCTSFRAQRALVGDVIEALSQGESSNQSLGPPLHCEWCKDVLDLHDDAG